MARSAKIILIGLGVVSLLTAYVALRALTGDVRTPLAVDTTGVSPDSYLRLNFDKLSNFPYAVYEVVNPSGGRPLIKSDDIIPAAVKGYDGKAVTVRGYVLALRLKKGLVQDFLLLRDQGTCCFGDTPQINHFIRVTLKGQGFKPGTITPVEVSGVLRVGETYVQGYLTGIYSLEADKVKL